MLPIETVLAIEAELRKDELSQRKIAAKFNVSRCTVGAIANGKRKAYGKEPEPEPEPVSEVPSRCPGCGEMVFLPCVICRTREYRRGRIALRQLERLR